MDTSNLQELSAFLAAYRMAKAVHPGKPTVISMLTHLIGRLTLVLKSVPVSKETGFHPVNPRSLPRLESTINN
jgi:hypothetical protein